MRFGGITGEILGARSCRLSWGSGSGVGQAVARGRGQALWGREWGVGLHCEGCRIIV